MKGSNIVTCVFTLSWLFLFASTTWYCIFLKSAFHYQNECLSRNSDYGCHTPHTSPPASDTSTEVHVAQAEDDVHKAPGQVVESVDKQPEALRTEVPPGADKGPLPRVVSSVPEAVIHLPPATVDHDVPKVVYVRKETSDLVPKVVDARKETSDLVPKVVDARKETSDLVPKVVDARKETSDLVPKVDKSAELQRKQKAVEIAKQKLRTEKPEEKVLKKDTAPPEKVVVPERKVPDSHLGGHYAFKKLYDNDNEPMGVDEEWQ